MTSDQPLELGLPATFHSGVASGHERRGVFARFPSALAELHWLYRIEQASQLREAACLRSSRLPAARAGTEERSDAIACARWFAAWQPTGPRSLADWKDRSMDLLQAMESDALRAAPILRSCVEQDLEKWPAASRLAREAEALDPCAYGRLVVARARLVEGRIPAAKRALLKLCRGAATSLSRSESIPRAVQSGALATLASLAETEELIHRSAPSSEQTVPPLDAFALARRAFLLEPSVASGLRLFSFALRAGRRGSARRAARILRRVPEETFQVAAHAPLRGMRSVAKLRELTCPRHEDSVRPNRLWLEYLGAGDRRLFELCLLITPVTR